MMPAGARATLKRYYTAVWQDGDVAALDELLSAGYVDHNPLPGFGAAAAAAKAMAAHVAEIMPGARLEVHHLIIEGDLAAAHWTMTWNAPDNAGSPGGRMRGHDFFRLREGRISEVWHCEAIQP